VQVVVPVLVRVRMLVLDRVVRVLVSMVFREMQGHP
jgi:hypothetical protein